MTDANIPRNLIDFSVSGLATAALACLNARCSRGNENSRTHHPPKIKQVIHICQIGGVSQVDTFDYKPALEELHGREMPGFVKPDTFFGHAGLMRKHEWNFRQRGDSGLWISDLFPHLAGMADELTVVRSMYSESANHTPAMFLQNSGFATNGFPSLGSWLSYGLGNESDSLPTFVVLPDARSLPNSGAANWTSGFLPAEHQGVVFRGDDQPVRNLFLEQPISSTAEADARSLLRQINLKHLSQHDDDPLLNARISAYELAAKMQTSVPEAIDFADESLATQQMYGLDDKLCGDFARRCLMARRLVERGVRFVQLYSGGSFGGKPRHGWDGHENNHRNHTREAAMIDQPVAGLIGDLRQRGMLEETLVFATSEFGRTPFSGSAPGVLGEGRDHNPEGFTVWLAGGGLKKGFAFGQTDEVGWRAETDRVGWPDFHATVLHLLGIDHEQLTFYHNGIQRRLTNVHGHVIDGILA